MGRQVINPRTHVVNILTWKAPPDRSNIASYRVYRDASSKKLAGVIHPPQQRFKDRFRKRGKAYHYYVVTVDREGRFSQPAAIIVD